MISGAKLYIIIHIKLVPSGFTMQVTLYHISLMWPTCRSLPFRLRRSGMQLLSCVHLKILTQNFFSEFGYFSMFQTFSMFQKTQKKFGYKDFLCPKFFLSFQISVGPQAQFSPSAAAECLALTNFGLRPQAVAEAVG